ncbi:MAG: ABC transporter substrate-binding protein, partial [Streptosporangiaceae bacterium]
MAAGAAALALVAAGCSSSGSNNSSSGTTPVKGGTAVWAEPPSSVPTYIFPYVDSSNISNLNLFDLQYLMYRPLYFFGENGQPQPNNSLSLANPPVVSGRNVTITLKHYMWSDGTQVTAQDVMFWLNMEKALPADYGAYTGFPANTTSIKVVSPTEIQMTMSKAYSASWLQYNDLSQIVPMPAAWDRTASGPSHCDTTVSDCAAVYSYLNKQAENLSGYATSPIWGVVDGPWRLSSFNADGHNTFVPNKKYSGPVKPKLSAFQEVPFTTDSAEYDVLRSPSASTKIDVGYLPDQDAPSKPANATVGSNPLSGYTLDPLYPWGIDYSVMNYQSSNGDHGAIFKQLYFRQALQYLMNQKAIISGPLRGYGALTVGPVAATPATKWLSSQGRAGDPYPYNPTKAKQLLASNGWKVVPNGTSTCAKPGTAAGECGAGITAGSALNF